MASVAVLIGTSGWHYDLLARTVFPERSAAQIAAFQFYASQFSSGGVEWRLHTGLLHRPTRSIAGASPDMGQKAISCSRGKPRCKFITHWKTTVGKLGQQSRTSRRPVFPCLETKLAGFDPSCFHRTSGRDADRLGEGFSRCCRATAGTASSFRMIRSWYTPRILKMLTERNISLCLSDHHRRAGAMEENRRDFVYVRGRRGPGGRYRRALRRPHSNRVG